MAAIVVKGLGKDFTTKLKGEGLRGSLASVLRPRYQTFVAVDRVDFTVEPGEIVAFIGPNGAGKSTTIKMLTGILHPSRGEAWVNGRVPWKERYALSFEIGSVFGQKSQLWYHLPPIDTFNLLGRIYELPRPEFRRRLEQLVELFELDELMEVPVRKLSLGQRMRCEVAASFLHRPRIVFLDEPTIGLDVVAKQKIRELVWTMNRAEGVTVFLTSHDTGDIEHLCRRVMVINRGSVILDTSVQDLKQNFIRAKVIDLKLGERVAEPPDMTGVTLLGKGEYDLKLRVDTARRPTHQVVEELVRRLRVVDITVSDPPLEEIITHIYRSETA